nr:hypothetical protein [Tanacetum cinerariifolium]
AWVEAESARSYPHKLAEEKMSLLVQLDQERAGFAVYMASCHWVVKWLISHGLCLVAMCTLESQEVKQSFGDVVKYALVYGRAKVMEELHENKLLTVSAVQVPGYKKDVYEELVATMEKMKLLERP